jgi:hypothetical protein
MGTEVVKAVNAADDLELVAMVDDGDWLFDLANAGAQVVVDFTRPDVVMENIRFCIDNNIHCVVGTTGFDEAKLATVAEWLEPKPDVGVVIAPNFGIGAVLLMKFAQGRRGSSRRWRSSSSTTPTRSTHPRERRCVPPAWWPRRAGPWECPPRRTRRATASRAPVVPTSRACRCTPSG